jgi:antirestriction protein ArdC
LDGSRKPVEPAPSLSLFGTESYAFEELIAETTAALCCASTGITPEPRPDHAQYLNSWLKVLRDDKRAIFTAFSKAQAAADFILEPPEPARPTMRRAPAAEPDAPAGMN